MSAFAGSDKIEYNLDMHSRHIRTIVAACLVAVIAFFAGYAVAPRQAEAPTTATALLGAPPDAIIIPISIVSIRETASSSPTVTIEYPQFPSLSADLNSAIASSTLSRLAQFRTDEAANEAARLATAPPGTSDSAAVSPSAFSFITTWQPAQVNSAYVSFIERYDSFVGGANEDQESETFNYDVAAHRMVSLADLFPGVPDYLQQISAMAREQLTSSMNQASNGSIPADMLDAATAPTADSFADFTFTDYEITIYFPKCDAAPCSFGEQSVTIPRNTPTAG